MESPTAPAVPAQPADAPVTISAEVDAANRGDFAAFDAAHLADKKGAPLAAVETSPTGEKTTTASPVVSKRQQDTNDRIRDAVERATAETRAENARLRAQLQPPAAPTAPRSEHAPPVAPTERDWKHYASLPDAPKLAQFDSVEEHTAAMSFFIAKQVHADTKAAERDHSEHEQLTAAQHARVDGFITRLNETKAADPEFVNKLTPEVKALKPFGALAPGEPSGPRNVIAEQVYDSPVAPAVLLHFSQHPEELARLETIPPSIAAMPVSVRARAHIQHIIREFGKLEALVATAATPSSAHTAPVSPAAAPSTISAAPAPPHTITRTGHTADPKTAALERKDFATFDQLEMAEQRAKRVTA